MVDRLDLAYFRHPRARVLGSSGQYAMAMIVRLAEHCLELFDARHDVNCHFAALLRRFRARIERGVEAARANGFALSISAQVRSPLADFLHARLQLLALEEDDENELIYGVALQGALSEALQ